MAIVRCHTPLPPMNASWRARYTAYLHSPVWAMKRAAVLERAGHRCAVCGKGGPLHVHHLTYVRCFHERISDLQAVCPACHEIADLERRSRAEDTRRGRRRKEKRSTGW